MNTPEENTSEENTNGADESAAENSGTENTDAAKDRTKEAPGTDRRPLGFWLRVVDARLTREFHALFEPDGLDRRDWMLLNAIAGTVDRGPVAARLERGGRRLRALVDRGWVSGEPGSWILTDEGRMAFERIGAKVAGFRARVAGAVSPEDFATTLATLEAIAAELGEGDDDSGRGGRGRKGRGFGPGFGWGRGGRGFGWGRGFHGGRGFDGGEGAGMHPHHHGHEHGPHGHEHGAPEFGPGHRGRRFGHRHGGPDFRGHGHGHGHGHRDCEHGHGRGAARDTETTGPVTPTTEV